MEAGNQRQGEKHREVQARSQCPQAHTGEAEPRTTVRHKRTKGETAVRGDQSERGKQRLRSKPKDSKAKRKTWREQGDQRQDRSRAGEEMRGRRREAAGGGCRRGVILTKETGGGAGRKSFPHQHILFQKSSKLSWNESERITESQPARERRERRSKKRCENDLKNGQQGLFLGLLTDLKPDSAT